jgi:signal transduction histidine kinase
MTETESQPPGRAAGPPAVSFADQVAHDLRNILNNLNLNLQYLEMTLDLNQPSTARAMQRMRDEVGRLRKLVEELPERARSEAGG